MSICARCLGTGAVSYQEQDRRELDDGSVMEMNTLGTRLCDCRALLPPREGRASWWDVETTYEQRVDVLIGEPFEVRVRPEVPVDREGYRVVRYGNRYWPTWVDLDDRMLFPEDARALAATLLQAADIAEGVDRPCTDRCGHWAPCNCGQTRETGR